MNYLPVIPLLLEEMQKNPDVPMDFILECLKIDGKIDPMTDACIEYGINVFLPIKTIRSLIQKHKAIRARDKRNNQDRCRGRVWESAFLNEKMFQTKPGVFVLRRYQEMLEIEKELAHKEELKQKNLKRDPEVLGPVAGSNIREALLAQANAVRNGGNQKYQDK